MSVSVSLPKHLRPHREKIYGAGRGIPLDRNAKARIMVYARGYNAKHRQKGQHRGPLTRAFLEVLEALLWGFHNSRSGLCYPSYESIAEKAECSRDTVYEALKALEEADVLTWANRLTRARVLVEDLFGRIMPSWKIIRTSNAYVFRDPLPCSFKGLSSKSENPPKTPNQDISLTTLVPKVIILDPDNPLDASLISFGKTLGSILY